jgi:hypothetical protein
MLLQECDIGSATFHQHRPGGITCGLSHRLACRVIGEFIWQQLTSSQIINNGLLNNLAGLLQKWSFWLPWSEWYVQGDRLSDNLRNYRNTSGNNIARLPTNQTLNHDSILLNQFIERPMIAIYPTQHSKVG